MQQQYVDLMPDTPESRKQLETLDRLQRSDHDALIRIEEAVKGVAGDFKEMKDGIVLQLAEHKLTMKNNEKKIQEIATEMQTYSTTLRNLKWAGGFILAALTYVIATLNGLFSLFNH